MDSQFLRLIATLLAVPVFGQLPPRARPGLPEYFPLAVGNQWLYVQRGVAPAGPVTVAVTFADQFNGVTYFELTGFGGERPWVRRTATGELVEWDRAGEKLWYPFAAPAGFSFRTFLPVPCSERAAVASRSADVETPAGRFTSALVVRYNPGSCADAGLIEEIFAPGVGLVRRSEQTIGGPRIWELAYARIGGVTVAGPELSFGLAIDRPVYFADFMPPVDPARSVPTMTARLTLRNSSALPLAVLFSSSQQYDLAIRDEAGRQVYLWSEGKFFLQVLTRLELSPGEKTFLIEVRLADRTGRTLPEGRYTVESWLTTSGGVKLYTASVPFELRYVF